MRYEYREHEPPGERWDWETYGPDEDIPERYVAADRARADAERARLRYKAASARQVESAQGVDSRLTYERMRAAEQVEARRTARRVAEWASQPARRAEHDDGTEAVA